MGKGLRQVVLVFVEDTAVAFGEGEGGCLVPIL